MARVFVTVPKFLLILSKNPFFGGGYEDVLSDPLSSRAWLLFTMDHFLLNKKKKVSCPVK